MKFPYRLMALMFVISIISLITLTSNSPYPKIDDEQFIAPSQGAVRVSTRLYFVYDNALYSEVHRVVVEDGNYETAVVEALEAGAANERFKSIFDLRVDVASVETINNTCYVNLTGDGLSTLLKREDKANLYLWSVVNSLTELKGVLKVQFMYNDKPLTYATSGFDFTNPVPRVSTYDVQNESGAKNTVLEFVEYLSRGRFDLAYNLLSSGTQKQMSYLEFIDYAQLLIKSIDGYDQTTSLTKVYSWGQRIYLRFEKHSKETDTILRIYQRFDVKKEGTAYRIDIKELFNDFDALEV